MAMLLPTYIPSRGYCLRQSGRPRVARNWRDELPIAYMQPAFLEPEQYEQTGSGHNRH